MEPPQYLVVAFHHRELPGDFDINHPGIAARRLAREKFGLLEADFDPAYAGHCGGGDGQGFVFEVQVSARAAARIDRERHPDLIAVFEAPPPMDFQFGALDPKDLPPIKRKPGGPRP
jgi:hypothetical protein